MTGTNRSLARIERLLDGQRRALLAGDLAALAAMPEPMEAALRSLERDAVAHDDLARVARMAARNAELIGAAGQAVAHLRASRQARGAAELGTYDRAGQRAPMTGSGRILARG